MEWIYLSPHFDDVALSCGGLVWEQTQAGAHVSIWTICAGDSTGDELTEFAEGKHVSWGTDHTAVGQRKNEDRNSAMVLGADTSYGAIPDCIYRKDPASGEYMYSSEESL